MSVSAHKWLYQPKSSALVMFREPQAAHEAVSFGSSYLAVPNIGLQGSRGDVALPLAATLLSWGRAGTAGRIEADLALAGRLADLVEGASELELWQRPVTGVVNWRPRDVSPERVRPHLRDAWVSLADIAGETWFRSVPANPLAGPHRVVDAVTLALDELG